VPTYTADVVSAAAPDVVFAYLAQFDNTVHWDPGVTAATPVSGPPELGAEFDLTLNLGGGAEVVRYKITEYVPPHRVVLVGDARRFVSNDEISVVPEGPGSRVTYRARLDLKGWTKLGGPFAGRALHKAGEAAIAGLTRELARLEP
jgi:hypothetical protein